MRLLLLGGPTFLGRAVLDAAADAGHTATMFNRGLSDASAYPEVERLVGDRDGELGALAGRRWDAAIDTCGYVPRVVRQAADVMAENVGHYVFVSSISAYASFAARVDEESPLARLDDPASEDISADYGALKAACEAVVEGVFPGKALHVRAGLIVGPHDPTGRFTYWPHRVSRGGEILVPGPLDRIVQFVDVRDLASWMVDAAERQVAGPMNAVHSHRLEDVLDAARQATGADPTVVPVDDRFLRAEGVGEWMELPLWIDSGNADRAHFTDIDATRAEATGLTSRPLVDTLAGALAEAETREGVGLSAERERALIARFRAAAA
jgi:2'-hydroxyisoflavone reductase